MNISIALGAIMSGGAIASSVSAQTYKVDVPEYNKTPTEAWFDRFWVPGDFEPVK